MLERSNDSPMFTSICDLPAPVDMAVVRGQCILTTHTPVPAGHDQFPVDLARRVLGDETMTVPVAARGVSARFVHLVRYFLSALPDNRRRPNRHEIAFKPIGCQASHLFQRARFLEEVGRARNDNKLLEATQPT